MKFVVYVSTFFYKKNLGFVFVGNLFCGKINVCIFEIDVHINQNATAMKAVILVNL